MITWRRSMQHRRLFPPLPLLLAAVTAVACGRAPANPSVPPPAPSSPPATAPSAPDVPGATAPEEPAPAPPDSYTWETISLSGAPGPVREYIAANRTEGGTLAHHQGGFTYVAILAGERPTGGYQVTIRSVRETSRGIEVRYRVQGPQPDQVVTAALTYPFALARFARTDKPVVFRQVR